MESSHVVGAAEGAAEGVDEGDTDTVGVDEGVDEGVAEGAADGAGCVRVFKVGLPVKLYERSMSKRGLKSAIQPSKSAASSSRKSLDDVRRSKHVARTLCVPLLLSQVASEYDLIIPSTHVRLRVAVTPFTSSAAVHM